MSPEDDAPTIMEAADEQVLTLVAQGGRLDGKRYSGFGRSLTLGRSRESSLAVPLPRMSRQQAQLELNGGRYWINDLSPLNPSAVNGVALKGGSAPLLDGDVLRAGDQDFLIKINIAHANIRNPDSHAGPSRNPSRNPSMSAVSAGFLHSLRELVFQRWTWVALAAVGLLTLAFFVVRPSTRSGTPRVSPLVTPAAVDAVAPSLELLEVVSERAPFAGEVRRIALPGSRVRPNDLLFELIRSSPSLLRARERMEALQKHAGDAEYRDFVQAARVAVQKEELRARIPIRATVEGIIVPAQTETRVGQTLAAGDQVLRMAGVARLHVGAEPLQGGAGPGCRVMPLGEPEQLRGHLENGRQTLTLETLPASPWKPEPGKVRIQCD